jgi:hypothetical protein
MCMNCGCMRPEDIHGNPENITLETIRKAAKAGKAKTIKEVMATMIETYNKKVKGTPADTKAV